MDHLTPQLEQIAGRCNYGDLPETWRVPDIERFSAGKTLYDYQVDALKNAARALYLYYGDAHDWAVAESPAVDDARKEFFAGLYGREIDGLDVKRYETRAAANNQIENPVFRILSPFIDARGDTIAYRNLINRMCFWMATGSGKTLVMVKLIEYLHELQKHREIPPHNILILAPSEHLLGQIRRTVEEFNQTGLRIELVPLRDMHRSRQARQVQLGDTVTVYYHRSDNISDVQKDALTDYAVYENDGKWFVLLDEAHKGGKENSKRQAYYAVLARRGFLFNFSATFTDAEDIVTTVKKYNLEEFVKHGHGKNIYLNEKQYDAFAGNEPGDAEKRAIVLKSLIALGFASIRVRELRAEAGRKLYHRPLMLTLVNSVNTDIENERNDLWSFFQTLRAIATGEIDAAQFRAARDELIEEWREASLFFGEGGGIVSASEEAMKKMKITDLREAVFLSRCKGALQVIRSGDNKELAFQLKNADAPFALIRIGDTSKWRNNLLDDYEETAALQEQSFFANLERSSITILMGSRAFFESWDSNRPNVINFINIGVGSDTKKFVMQAVGRGVRIETLPGVRGRFSFLPPKVAQQPEMQAIRDRAQLPETLFLFATNRAAINAVFDRLKSEKRAAFEELDVFDKAPREQIGDADMPLLKPAYRKAGGAAVQSKFCMDKETLERFQAYLAQTSDALLVVRDGLIPSQIAGLRAAVADRSGIDVDDKNYAMLSFLQSRLLSHLAKTAQESDGVRELDDDDIVHFRHIRALPDKARELRAEIKMVKDGEVSPQDKRALAGRYAQGEIDEESFKRQMVGKDASKLDDLTIKKLAGHYYLPVVWGSEKSDYIQHIIKVPSEVDFLTDLEKWLGGNPPPAWDAWMFSKIDEALDSIHIPYYDPKRNEYRKFHPDFMFWMCKGDRYRIVFVDPKGTEHTQAARKIKGYKKLFETNDRPREFLHRGRWQVSVRLLYFNPDAHAATDAYKSYWSSDPGAIFA